jgi:DNA-directed RNA polymerase specialized sigma24 family protein
MLKELAKNDSKWREMAYYICNRDKQLADDITQEMYFLVMDKQNVTAGYIFTTLKNLFRSKKNKAKKEPVSLDGFYYIEDTTKQFEPTDAEQKILDKAKNIKWHRLEFIKESYDRSNREIADTYDINYGFVFRETKLGIQEILNEDYYKYQNSKLKWQKNK